jgi:hypothetical protein
MSLRIACDIDGTLADMGAALAREAAHVFDEPIDMSPPARARVSRVAGAPQPSADSNDQSPAAVRPRRLDSREQNRLWNHVRDVDNFWETLAEIEPGAVARFAHTAIEHGWEVLFLTQRPGTAGDNAQVQSQRWLRAHGFELPSVYVMSERRGGIAASLSLDVVIDDSPENCLDVSVDSSASPVLVWRHAREHLPPGVSRFPIHVVTSMADAIEYLTRLPARASADGLLGRLRHALLP